MVTIDATALTHDGVTLVTAILEGGPVPTRVTLRNRLDGPVWPPRRAGEPVAGWTDDGYEGVVPADETVALGYACPAPPEGETDDPPLDVVSTERAPDGGDGAFDSPSAVLRGLGGPAPPRDAVPLPAPEGDEDDVDEPPRQLDANADSASAESATDDSPRDRALEPRSNGDAGGTAEPDQPAPTGPTPTGPTPTEPETPPTRTEREQRSTLAEPDSPTASDDDLPEPVLAWLERTARRVERAEALAEATDVPAATAAVREVGSLDAVADLERRRSTDAERLREIASRANALAYRAESATVPLETLERLA